MILHLQIEFLSVRQKKKKSKLRSKMEHSKYSSRSIFYFTGCFTQTATKEIDTVSDLNEPAEKQKKI